MDKFYKGEITLGVFERDEQEMVKEFLNNYEHNDICFVYNKYFDTYEITEPLNREWYDKFKKDFLSKTGIKLHSDIKDCKERIEKNPDAPLGYYIYEDWTWYVKGIDIRVEPGSVLVDYPKYYIDCYNEESAIKIKNRFKDSVYTLADYNEDHNDDPDGYGYYDWNDDEDCNYKKDNAIGWTSEDIANAPICKMIKKNFGEYEVRCAVVFPEPHELNKKSVVEKDILALDQEIKWKRQELDELLLKREGLLKEVAENESSNSAR